MIYKLLDSHISLHYNIISYPDGRLRLQLHMYHASAACASKKCNVAKCPHITTLLETKSVKNVNPLAKDHSTSVV